MIDLGKKLTYAGIAGFATGIGCIGTGFVTVVLALYASGFPYHLHVHNNNWPAAWKS